MIVAGMDEAGYGPYLGPLLVGWTAFRVPDPPEGQAPACLWKTLKAAVRKQPTGAEAKVWVADSKLVRPRKDGLRLLELAALSFVAQERIARGQAAPRSLGELVAALGGDMARYDGCPWYEGLATTKLPVHGWAGEIAGRAERIAKACADTGVAFAGAAAVALPEWEFNACLVPEADARAESPTRFEAKARYESKAEVMQLQAFAPLLQQMRARFAGELLDVVADKHGGRDRYAPLLERIFPGASVRPLVESARSSQYRLETSQGPISIRFEPESDQRHFSVALASMICKYLRELFMDRLNAFFRDRVSAELKPTAGYPGDAERFIRSIEGSLPKLGIDRGRLVRVR